MERQYLELTTIAMLCLCFTFGCSVASTESPQATASEAVQTVTLPVPTLAVSVEVTQSTPSSDPSPSIISQSTIPVAVTPLPSATIPATSPTSHSATSSQGNFPIYFVAQGETKAQIWQISSITASPALIYEIVRNIGTSPDEILPPEEFKLLEDFLETLPTETVETIHKVLPSPGITDLTLSSTGEGLAWVEYDDYCVQYTNVCVGVQRLKVFDLLEGTSKILLEFPRHQRHPPTDESFDLEYGPVWSPDSQYIGVIRRFGSSEAVPIIIEVATNNIQEITEEVNASPPLVWSPASEVIAWSYLDDSLRICRLNNQGCEDIKQVDINTWGKSLGWGPYGNQVAYIAEGTFKLRLYDPATDLFQEVPVALSNILENPRWSPHQRLAVDSKASIDDFFQSLVVIDPTSGQIVNELQQERSEAEWVWGKDGQSILVLTGTHLTGYGIGIFNVAEGSLELLPIPNDLTAEDLRYPTW